MYLANLSSQNGLIVFVVFMVIALPCGASNNHVENNSVLNAQSDTAVSVRTTSLTNSEQSKKSPEKLTGGVSKDDLIFDLDSRFGIQCSLSGNKLYKAVVTKVRLGSVASYLGILAGDHILSAKAQADAVQLEIERNGKIYATKLAPEHPSTTLVTSSAPTQFAEVIRKELKNGALYQGEPALLGQYDVDVIIDRTRSMNTNDCPDGLTRWNWCQTQTSSLLNIPFRKFNMLIITDDIDGRAPHNFYPNNWYPNFDMSYRAELHELVDTYTKTSPLPGEHPPYFADYWIQNLVAAINRDLQDYCHKYTSKQQVKPLLIVIVAGEPFDIIACRQSAYIVPLFERYMHQIVSLVQLPDNVDITFLEVGDNTTEALKSVDGALFLSGTKSIVIHTKTHPEVERMGLERALIDTISQPKFPSERK